MPGPGQGKNSQKNKWRENTFNLNVNIVAINSVMITDTLTVRMDPLANETALLTMLLPSNTIATDTHTSKTAPRPALYMAPLSTTAETTANPTTNDASNVTSIDTATAMSSTNNIGLQPQLLTYSTEEVQKLLANVRLDGWQEGYEEGSKKLIEGYRDGYEAQ